MQKQMVTLIVYCSVGGGGIVSQIPDLLNHRSVVCRKGNVTILANREWYAGTADVTHEGVKTLRPASVFG